MADEGHPVYEPREDSYLLLQCIRPYARGRVLDMGTGSGVLARESARYADEVVAADINPQAIVLGKRLRLPKITWIESDLFADIKGRFDLIVFNPPYLPDDPRAKDIALDGGLRGHELIERFLMGAKRHLNPDGRVLLLFSSRTGKEVVEAIMAQEGYSAELLREQALDFERLYVYALRWG
ncbi:methyltransferase [Candidatus Woesearchaeota archaeon]|nr:methyltransferase [Candidatus Woesearchaeota archaeon]